MACTRGCCDSYRAHLLSVTTIARPSQITLTERRWEHDMDAYRRMRQMGTQPPHIDGCARLEAKANTQVEMDTGRIIPDPVARRVLDQVHKETKDAPPQ